MIGTVDNGNARPLLSTHMQNNESLCRYSKLRLHGTHAQYLGIIIMVVNGSRKAALPAVVADKKAFSMINWLKFIWCCMTTGMYTAVERQHSQKQHHNKIGS